MPPAVECSVNPLEYLKIILPSLLVILGWFVVYNLQRKSAFKTENRKDLRARVDRLEEDLRDLRDKCIEYYMDVSKGFETSTQIKVLTEDVRRQSLVLSRNFFRNLDNSKVTGCLINLMTAATGGKFESHNRISLKSNDQQLSQLFHHSALLITIFEDGFFEAYPPAN